MAVRALAPAAAGDELTVSYVNTYEPRAARRAATLATKGFACDCARCAAPLATSFDRLLQGAACRCGDVCVADDGDAALDWKCAGCGCVRHLTACDAFRTLALDACHSQLASRRRKRDGGAGAAAAGCAAAALDAAMTVYAERGHAAAEPLFLDVLRTYEKVRPTRVCWPFVAC
jgi:hypothetical protein